MVSIATSETERIEDQVVFSCGTHVEMRENLFAVGQKEHINADDNNIN